MIMKSTINKAVLMICASLLIISLAACGANNNADKSTASTEASETSSAAEAPAPAATDAAIETKAEVSADTGLVGSWDYVELSGIVYTFNADGTGNYDMLGEVMRFTYEADGSVLKLQYTDEGIDTSTQLEYAIDGDTLTVKDSLGNDTIYKRK